MGEPVSPETRFDGSAPDPDLISIVRAARLDFPIESKERFVRQLESSADNVTFRGTSYETSAVASLIPEFFFPVLSEADLLEKGQELLAARGLAPTSAYSAEAE